MDPNSWTSTAPFDSCAMSLRGPKSWFANEKRARRSTKSSVRLFTGLSLPRANFANKKTGTGPKPGAGGRELLLR